LGGVFGDFVGGAERRLKEEPRGGCHGSLLAHEKKCATTLAFLRVPGDREIENHRRMAL
jgi:hypothetical protein